MIEPKIDDLLAAVDSKYSLVILSAITAPFSTLQLLSPTGAHPSRVVPSRSVVQPGPDWASTGCAAVAAPSASSAAKTVDAGNILPP